jgi:hypothetical protein
VNKGEINTKEQEFITFELGPNEAAALEREVNLTLFGATVSSDDAILMVPDRGESVSELEQWIRGIADHVGYPYNTALKRVCEKLLYQIS